MDGEDGVGYDSDDECLVRSGTPMHARQARAAAVANLENMPPVPPVDLGAAAKYVVSFRGADVRSPLTVEREWMDELDRAMERAKPFRWIKFGFHRTSVDGLCCCCHLLFDW